MANLPTVDIMLNTENILVAIRALRCNGCKHWGERNSIQDENGVRFGVCNKLLYKKSKHSVITHDGFVFQPSYGVRDHAIVRTREDFFCSSYEGVADESERDNS